MTTDMPVATPPFATADLHDELRGLLTELWESLSPQEQRVIAAVLTAVRESGQSLRFTVGNLKGGAAKSTTTMYLALMLAFLGESVLVVDADSRNNSVLTWKAGIDAQDLWPMNIQVMPWGTPDLAKRVRAMEGQFKHLIIDTGPVLQDILEAALMVTDTFLVASLPNPMDVQQVVQSVELAEKIDGHKAALDAGEMAPVVLLVRTVSEKSRLLRQARQYLDKEGYPHLPSVVLTRQSYANSYPSYPASFLDYLHVFPDFVAFALGLPAIPGIEGHVQINDAEEEVV